jgi:hypothetical protein
VNTENSRNKTNNDKSNNNQISRRGFLEVGSAVTGVAGVLAMTGIASAQELVPGVKTGKSTHITDPGPTDKQLDAANPDVNVPPLTDGGGLPTFKYPQAWQLDPMVRSTLPTTFADGSTGLIIAGVRTSALPMSRRVRVQQLRPAIPFKKPRNRQRARIPTPAE